MFSVIYFYYFFQKFSLATAVFFLIWSFTALLSHQLFLLYLLLVNFLQQLFDFFDSFFNGSSNVLILIYSHNFSFFVRFINLYTLFIVFLSSIICPRFFLFLFNLHKNLLFFSTTDVYSTLCSKFWVLIPWHLYAKPFCFCFHLLLFFFFNHFCLILNPTQLCFAFLFVFPLSHLYFSQFLVD